MYEGPQTTEFRHLLKGENKEMDCLLELPEGTICTDTLILPLLRFILHTSLLDLEVNKYMLLC